MSHKSLKIRILEKMLYFMAIVVLKKYKPHVIGITGSVGKTSAKEAIFHVLSPDHSVRQTQKNYNNELGVPLTIIGVQSGGNSIIRWIGVVMKWLAVVVLPLPYPKILVLEMGIDQPGDMAYLTSFVPIHTAVVTCIPEVPVHVEFFKNARHVVKEKELLVKAVDDNGTVILDADSPHVAGMTPSGEAEVVTYGCGEGATIQGSGVTPAYDEHGFHGLSFKVSYEGKVIPVRLHHVVARHHLSVVLSAIAVGMVFKVNLVDMAKQLESLMPPTGRMRRLHGTQDSVIIDDTYNSSPRATHAALETLMEVPARRHIAVLGDMLELGAASEEAHRAIGADVVDKGVELFFAVGERMEAAYAYAQKQGYGPEQVQYFEDPTLAGQKLAELVAQGDVVLVKGSQSMRMEKVIEQIMAHPEAAGELLCRQSAAWKAKPYVKP